MDRNTPLDQQLLLKHVPGMVYRCRNDEAWTMLFVSAGCKSLTGYSPDDLLNNAKVSYASLIYPDDRTMVEKEVRDAVRGRRPFRCTYRMVARDGTIKWVWEQGEAVRTEEKGTSVLQGYITDITEERSKDEALVESRESFNQLADSMPLIVWSADSRGTTDFTSRAFTDYTGTTSGDDMTPAERWRAAIHPADMSMVSAAWRVANQTATNYTQEYRLLNKDGVYRWHLSQARPIRDRRGNVLKWYGATIDVHDQRLLLQDARRLANRLINTLESITDAFITLDQNWRLTYINAKAEELLGVKRENLLGRIIWAEYPGADVFEKHYRKAVAEQITQEFTAEYQPLQKTFEVRAYPSGEGLAVYFRDVTSQLAMQDRLRQSQYLGAIGQLTGGVAHDFNNLLTVILGNAELLEEDLEKNEALQPLATMIREAAGRGAELTRRLLAFARRQALEPQITDIRALVTSMESLLRRTVQEDIDIRLIHDGPVQALVDPVQLEAVLLNLCVNARDAMLEGGRLTIETGTRCLDEEYAAAHTDVVPGMYVMLSVSDTGTGIAPDVLPRVFDPFFTTKPQGQGSGLGLSMAYGFVKQSHGHISLYSELGQGTTINMYLPQCDGVPLTIDANVAALAGGSESILLVEDDELVREYTARLLQGLGYDVVVANNGNEGLEIIRSSRPLDLLLTDMIMPGGLNGRQLAEAAVQERPQLKVLFMSGYTENAIVHQGRLDPGVHLLNKPYQRSELANKVRMALGDD
ncbi:MAG: PAS domain-containing protein [Gammaproteobacteria bacterium]|nr:PAS domain-containing protein [Gammaproteobacteria bacterium]MDP2346363.1 PAS domain-containing protein [Gammaproteobacteria bacterium]